jgi:poly-gamma-glutamate capsule biosynthesis protein CapA/YwtB (metallophosphatase superfamily)
VSRRHRPKHAARSSGPFRLLLIVFAATRVGAAATSFVMLSEGEAATTAAVPSVTATPTTRHPVLGSGRPVTIAFAGDTFFDGSLADRLAADPASVLAPVAPILSGADLAVVNMETALGGGGAPQRKTYTFQAPPVALEAYRAAGVDVVSAANNHGMDYGPDSFQETLRAEIDSSFPIVGIGQNEAEAYTPFVTEINGQRIAVLAASQVIDDHLVNLWTAGPAQPGLASALPADRLVRAVTEARTLADTVVVYLHWGIERVQCPSRDQRTLARQLVDAGADVVVGSHAHQLLGGGRLGNAVVHYGLGNFAFSSRVATDRVTGIFVVTVTGQRVDGYEWVPARMIDRQPVPVPGVEAAAARADWEDLRRCTDLTP